MKAPGVIATLSILWWEAFAGSCPFFARTSPPVGTYLCPKDTVNYTCTINDTSINVITTWTVTQQCSTPLLLAQRSAAGPSLTGMATCGNLTARTTDITGTCYTSVLTIVSPRYANGSSVICSGTSTVGNETLNVLLACPPSPPTITPVSCTSSSLTINWTYPFDCGSPIAQYTLTTNPPSQDCNPTCIQSPDLRQATLAIQPNKNTTVTLRADNCRGDQAGQTSSSLFITQAIGTLQDFKGIPVFSAVSQRIIRIDFTWTPMTLQLSPGGLLCGSLPNYTLTINNGTQTLTVLCSSSPCKYSWELQNPVTTPSYNISLTGLSLSPVWRQIATTNNILNISAFSTSRKSVITCTFLSGLVGTSGCVVSFGTSPDQLLYTITSSQSGGSGQNVSVELTLNGAPLAPNTIYYFAVTTSASLLTVTGSFQTANYSIDCSPLALGGQTTSKTAQCPGKSTLLITNGYICYGPSLELGSVATHYCNQGYQVVGTSVRSCLWTGDWSGISVRCDSLPPSTGTSGAGAVGGVVGGVLGGVLVIAIILIVLLILWKFGPGRLWAVEGESIVHVKVHRKDKRIEDDFLASTIERGSASDVSGQKHSPKMSSKMGVSNSTPSTDNGGQELDPTSGQQLTPSLSLTSYSIPPGKRSTIALQPKRTSKVLQSTNSLTFVDITKEEPHLEKVLQKETQS